MKTQKLKNINHRQVRNMVSFHGSLLKHHAEMKADYHLGQIKRAKEVILKPDSQEQNLEPEKTSITKKQKDKGSQRL